MTAQRIHSRYTVLRALTLVGCVVGSLSAGVGHSQTTTGGDGPRWVLTGNLSVPRHEHTATLLQNGKVLVAGGSSGIDAHRSAELYDPATGKWNATGDMNTPRADHKAALLPDGKVLVIGGWNMRGAARAAELYDPGTGTWSYASAPAVVRLQHTVTRLNNGKVLLAGGFSSQDLHDEPIAELYHPFTDTWSRTGSLLTNRTQHQATLLQDGRVLVTGGYGPGGYSQPLSSAEMFDPVTGTWSTVADLPHGRTAHTATLLSDGNVLIAGVGNVLEAHTSGDNNKLDRAGALFDPALRSWREAGMLKQGRGGHTATLLPSGRVLIAGGLDKPGIDDFDVSVLESAELYDPRRRIWIRTSDLNVPRVGHTATLLANGNVLVVGGTLNTDAGIQLGTLTELYESGASGNTIGAGHTGSWFDPAQNGHGFALEVLQGEPSRLMASWFVFAPQGGQSWVVGVGPISGNRAVLQAFQTIGAGGRFPPNYDAMNVRQEPWGTLTFTFDDCDFGRVEWVSSVPGYGSGGMDLTRLTLPAGLTCSP